MSNNVTGVVLRVTEVMLGVVEITGIALLARLKIAVFVMPLAPAETVYVPKVPLAVAVTLAVLTALIVAGLPLKIADAPLSGGVNVTRPPATGSFGLLAVTVATSGAGKAVKIGVDCPLPDVTAIVNRFDSKAPMSTMTSTMRASPRWSVVIPAV